MRSFFSDWHIVYLDPGENYGEGVALGENSRILETILSAGVRREERLEMVLGEKADLSHTLLITSQTTIYETFEGNRDFVSRWSVAPQGS